MNGKAVDIIAEGLFGPSQLTRGLDNNGDGTVTARWHRVKGNCEFRASFRMPMIPSQTALPFEIWKEARTVIDDFVLAAAYGRAPSPEDEPTDAEWQELGAPEGLLTSP